MKEIKKLETVTLACYIFFILGEMTTGGACFGEWHAYIQKLSN